jgi:glycosyltransferase involved in cell wall biosynthesis
MQILYLSQYFPPEAGATQTRAHEMARNWVRMGHIVTMIAEVPNHPSGIIAPQFRGKLFDVSDLDGIRVIRVWVAASPVKNFRNRMLFYLSYMLTATLAGLFLARGHFDLIYATSPPLFVGGAALAIHWLRRVPLFFEVRDLWPESAVALGEIRSKRAIHLASKLEETCYHRARKIIVVTEGIYNRLIERGMDARKIILIPNGANTELFHFDQPGRKAVRAQYGWSDHIVIMYAGIHGVAQGLEFVIEVAMQMRNLPEFQFVLIGDGPKKSDIKSIADQLALPNLSLLDEQPRDKMPSFLSAADAMIIPLRKIDLFKGALPSKLFDAWACERPVLLSVDGEARQILELCQGGWFVPPEDAPEMVAALLLFQSMTDTEREAVGRRGRLLTINKFTRQALAEKLIASLAEEMNNR